MKNLYFYSPDVLKAELIPQTNIGKSTTPPSKNTGTNAAAGINPKTFPI